MKPVFLLIVPDSLSLFQIACHGHTEHLIGIPSIMQGYPEKR